MAELNPPLGTTTPEIFLDNVKRADELVNGPAGTVNDRGGEPLDTWRQMMAKTMRSGRTSFRSASST